MRQELIEWFATLGWKPFAFQTKTWAAYRKGESGLVHAPTGLGKTYAVYGGPLIAALGRKSSRGPFTKRAGAEPLRLLWVTPLRALANDTAEALRRPAEALGLNWNVELRHGDVAASVRARQKKRLPTVLVTTPESLTLLLTYPDAREKFASLECVVCDEWHELLGTKRGVQTELALARLRAMLPKLRVWGLSATLGNLDEAMRVLLGPEQAGTLIRGRYDKQIIVETLLPDAIEAFPWSGHLGIKLVKPVIEKIEQGGSTLVFTNTRSQTELWYQALMREAPALAELVAVHHGSIDREERLRVEERLNAGELKAVVCTSSLDLGVDFTPVDQVIQVGSPKGIARLMQRAGRSGHRPGAVSRLIGVPTNALEIIEFAAARDALGRGEIESRQPIRRALDVLLQHLVSVALEGRSTLAELEAELRSTHAFAEMTPEEWDWAVKFVTEGGDALSAYPEYQKVSVDPEGRLRVESKLIERFHRMGIGTITSDGELLVKFANGQTLGSVEEGYVSRLNPGAMFHFAGRKLKLQKIRNQVVTVTPAPKSAGSTPTWAGGRSPLSTELSQAVSRKLAEWRPPNGLLNPAAAPEMAKVAPLLAVQAERSMLPGSAHLLCEFNRLERQYNLFVFPFAGRLVNEGLAALAAYRLSREQALSLRLTVNDYGFSLQAGKKFSVDEELLRRLLGRDSLLDDLIACLNAAEMAKRQFREIARVAGLVIQGYPGQQKSTRQLQASSGLLFDVFERYDPHNKLLEQARREILERQLELSRLKTTLDRLQSIPLILKHPPRMTPMAFPLFAEQLNVQVSSESWTDRVARLALSLEAEWEASKG